MSSIRFRVSPGFLLWVAWLNYLDDRNIVPQALLACLLHECGHLAAIRLQNGRVRSVSLTAAGAKMDVDARFGYRQELLSALAGPAVNLLLSALFAQSPRGYLFSGLNLALACLNLIPVGPLDGGRILRCMLYLLLPEPYVHPACRWIDTAFVAALAVISMIPVYFAGNFTLVMVALWLLITFSNGKNGFPPCFKTEKKVE